MKRVVIVDWTEYERGWGCRPDGVSVHLSVEDARAYAEAYNQTYNNAPSAPDEYSMPEIESMGIAEVSDELWEELRDLRSRTLEGLRELWEEKEPQEWRKFGRHLFGKDIPQRIKVSLNELVSR